MMSIEGKKKKRRGSEVYSGYYQRLVFVACTSEGAGRKNAASRRARGSSGGALEADYDWTDGHPTRIPVGRETRRRACGCAM